MKLIVGLWNPGDKYIKTRHNIWFVILDQFVNSNQIGDFSYDNKYGWEVISITSPHPLLEVEGTDKIYFLKPMEYMNKSGDAVQRLMNFYKIEASDLLVLHDDIDLAVWTVKLKLWWWLAGHNWLKSITEKIGTKEFSRIRIWVDRPSHSSQDVADYVLWNFKKEEIETIQDRYLDIDKIILDFIRE